MKFKNRLGLYLPLFIIFTAAAIVTRTIALFVDFNILNNYFDDKLLVCTSNVLAIIGTAFSLSFLLVKNKPNVVADFKTPATYIPSGLVAVALAFFSVNFLVTIYNNKSVLFNKARLSHPEYLSSVFMLMSAILALAAVINFLLNALSEKKENENRAFFGLLTIIFLAVYAAYLYFDIKLPINSPNKTVDQLAFLFAACFFLYETRISLGIEKWRGYVAFGLSSALLLAYSSVPALIYYLAYDVNVSDSLPALILALTLFIYISSRILLINLLPENKKSETVSAIEELAKIRSEELTLPISARLDSKDESFATLGENYEMNLHLVSNTDSEKDDKAEEKTEEEENGTSSSQ